MQADGAVSRQPGPISCHLAFFLCCPPASCPAACRRGRGYGGLEPDDWMGTWILCNLADTLTLLRPYSRGVLYLEVLVRCGVDRCLSIQLAGTGYIVLTGKIQRQPTIKFWNDWRCLSDPRILAICFRRYLERDDWNKTACNCSSAQHEVVGPLGTSVSGKIVLGIGCRDYPACSLSHLHLAAGGKERAAINFRSWARKEAAAAAAAAGCTCEEETKHQSSLSTDPSIAHWFIRVDCCELAMALRSWAHSSYFVSCLCSCLRSTDGRTLGTLCRTAVAHSIRANLSSRPPTSNPPERPTEHEHVSGNRSSSDKIEHFSDGQR